ncbi:MAG: hypothetical protein JXR03_13130 [Cyclobacteriaceae bacterium]
MPYKTDRPDQKDLFGNLLVKNLYFEDAHHAIERVESTTVSGLDLFASKNSTTANLFINSAGTVSVGKYDTRSGSDRWDKTGEPSYDTSKFDPSLVKLNPSLDVYGLLSTDFLWVEHGLSVQDLTVEGHSNLKGGATVHGLLKVNGTLEADHGKFCCTLEVGLSDDDTHKGEVTIGRSTANDGKLTVNGASNFNGTLDVAGTLTVKGNEIIEALKVGDVALDVKKGITNLLNTNVAGTLAVHGNETITAAAATDVALTVNVGVTKLKNTDVSGTLTVKGNEIIEALKVGDVALDVKKGITNLLNTNVTGTLAVHGNETIAAAKEADVALDVTVGITNLKNTNVAGTLNVKGNEVIEAATETDVALHVTKGITNLQATNMKDTFIDGTLKVKDTTTLQKDVFVGVEKPEDITSNTAYKDLYKEFTDITEPENLKLAVQGDAAIHGTLYAEEIITTKKAQNVVLKYVDDDDLLDHDDYKFAYPGQMFFDRSNIFIFTPSRGVTYQPGELLERGVKGQWESVRIGEFD